MTPAGTRPAGATQETFRCTRSPSPDADSLTLSGAAAATGLFARLGARACPNLEDIPPAVNLAKSINAFAGDLHARLAKDEKGSLFFSPFSIETALAMTAAGARGETFAEMERTLHLPKEPHAAFSDLLDHLAAQNNPFFPFPRPDPALPAPFPPKVDKRGYELTTANAIWAMKDYPWRKEFMDLTRKHYGAGLTEVDFAESEAARKRINAWVEKETRAKIKDLIGPGVITSLTRMVLANAIYFKGIWQYQFDKKNTTDAAFTRADGSKADVPLMYQTGTFGYGTMHIGGRAGQSVQILELPYTNHALSMLVFLPEKADGANRIPLWLKGEDLTAPKLKKTEARVFLPRFKVETEYSLEPTLKDLGMKLAFDNADFSGMHSGTEHLFISHVLHKAFVEVNEEGTEAAAATAVVVAADSARVTPEPVVFRADRPFVYVIRDNKTGTALFVGRYSGPTK